MKIAKVILIFLFFASVMFFTAQSASAGCAVKGGVDPLGADPSAPGTKYVGPLAVYYDKGMSGDTDDKICWFIRLRKGQTLYSFAECWHNYDPVTFDTNDWIQPTIAKITNDYFPRIVIPEIYECTYPDDCPPAFLKTYDQDVGIDNGPTPDAPELWDWWVMDISVAVQD